MKYWLFLQEFLQHSSKFILKEVYQFSQKTSLKYVYQNTYSKTVDMNEH